jgi:hypothetical protein
MFPEGYSKERLQSYLKLNNDKTLRRELKLFRARSLVEGKMFQVLCYFGHKKATVEAKQIFYRLYTIEREYRATHKLSSFLPKWTQ